jgi:hypothetical protein
MVVNRTYDDVMDKEKKLQTQSRLGARGDPGSQK